MSDTARSFVEAEKQAGRNVSKACDLLEVSRSAYLRLDQPAALGPSPADAALVEQIAEIHAESRHLRLAPGPGRAGRGRGACRPQAGGPADGGRRAGRGPPAAHPPDDVAGAEARAVNLVNRVFGPGNWELDRAWCGDITYVRTWEGWAYLATVIDLASRRVVGWAMADNMETVLVADAMRMAIDQRPGAGVVVPFRPRIAIRAQSIEATPAFWSNSRCSLRPRRVSSSRGSCAAGC